MSQESLERRLLAGLGNKGGSRGSLTKCVGRIAAWEQAVALGAPSAEALRSEAIREVQLMQLEWTKLIFLIQRQKKEFVQNQKLVASQQNQDDANLSPEDFHAKLVAEERARVCDLRETLDRTSAQMRCQQEYETLAKLATIKHSTSGRSLRAQLSQAQSDLQTTQAAWQQAQAQVRIRQAQFQTLMQHITDLKLSLTEPLPVPESGAVMDEEDDQNQSTGMEEIVLEDDKNEDEEGELYDDI